MTSNEYVEEILKRYKVQSGPSSLAERTANNFAPIIRNWASQWLDSLSLSGSYAKNTAVRGGSDVDLFISLKSDTPNNLKEIYESLFQLASNLGLSPRRQNVSIGVHYNELKIDLVPARIQPGYRKWHSLYKRKTDSWTQTNVSSHIETVGNSLRTKEIRALKIWRNLRNIDFPSFFLELTTINALSHRSTVTLADNVLIALRYIGSSLASLRIEDPANSNNCISDDLTHAEKQAIASTAWRSAQARNWSEIIW